MLLNILFVGLTVAIYSTNLFADTNPNLRVSTALDIYNRDQALIRETRLVDFQKGLNTIDFIHIDAGIYGHTAQVKPLEKEDRIETESLAYHFDLASHEKILQRYLGQWFSFSTEDAEYYGRLLYFDAEYLYLQPDTTDELLEVVGRGKLEDMYYPKLPEALFLHPTLRWRVQSEKTLKEVPVEISYLTSGVNWVCDYRAELIDDTLIALSGHFTIRNDLPLDFPDANLSLIAGWTHRSEDPEGGDQMSAANKRKSENKVERLFEYYRYDLDNPIDLYTGQTILVPFFNDVKITAERKYILPHLLDGNEVQIRMEFVNDEVIGPNKPLPEGDIGLYRRSSRDVLTFVGEDYLAAVPSGGKVQIDVGSALNLTGKRTRVAQMRPERNRHSETWRVELTSGMVEDCIVLVEQRVFGYYQVENAEAHGIPIEHEQDEAGKVVFPVKVHAGEKAVLTFTLTYGY